MDDGDNRVGALTLLATGVALLLLFPLALGLELVAFPGAAPLDRPAVLLVIASAAATGGKGKLLLVSVSQELNVESKSNLD